MITTQNNISNTREATTVFAQETKVVVRGIFCSHYYNISIRPAQIQRPSTKNSVAHFPVILGASEGDLKRVGEGIPTCAKVMASIPIFGSAREKNEGRYAGKKWRVDSESEVLTDGVVCATRHFSSLARSKMAWGARFELACPFGTID